MCHLIYKFQYVVLKQGTVTLVKKKVETAFMQNLGFDQCKPFPEVSSFFFFFKAIYQYVNYNVHVFLSRLTFSS